MNSLLAFHQAAWCLLHVVICTCVMRPVQENPDLFKWLTGQQEAPSDLLSNRAYQVGSPWLSQSTPTPFTSNYSSETDINDAALGTALGCQLAIVKV